MSKIEISLLRQEMKEEFNKVNETLLKLIDSIQKLDRTSSRMDNHINFVEETYNTVRSPLSFVVSQINRLIGTEDVEELHEYSNSQIE